jgi:hypothetical protein
VPEELQQTWLVDLSRDDIRADMEKAGFGKYVDKFYKSEDVAERVVMAVTYEAGDFEVAYLQPDQSWQVGWYGPLAESDGVLTMTDSYFNVEDSYNWSVTDEGLVLDFNKTTGDMIRGIPSEAYSRAYFSRPLAPVDCGPDDLDACLN